MGARLGVDQAAQRRQVQRTAPGQGLQGVWRQVAALQGHGLAALQVLEPATAGAQQHLAPVGAGQKAQAAVGLPLEAAAGVGRKQAVHHVIGRQRRAQHMAARIQRQRVQRRVAHMVGHQQRAAARWWRSDGVAHRAAAGGQDHHIGLQAATVPAQPHAAFGRLVQSCHLHRKALHGDALDRCQRGRGAHGIGQEIAIAPARQVALGVHVLALAAQPGDEGLAVVRQQAQAVGGVVEQVVGAVVAPVGKAGPEIATGLEHADALHRAAVDQLQQGRCAGEAAADDGHMCRLDGRAVDRAGHGCGGGVAAGVGLHCHAASWCMDCGGVRACASPQARGRASGPALARIHAASRQQAGGLQA